jgi:hypothetical protein
VIVLINNDIEVITSGWLTEMTNHALRPEVGCVGAKLDEKKATSGMVATFCGLRRISLDYLWWAVLGSNQWLPPCEGGTLPLS